MASSAPWRVEDDEWEDDEGERWANHYSSWHEILLVGEGDFSFSLSLANSFGSACNIVATSLDPHDIVVDKYAKAKSNLESLANMRATILHGVDATKMKLHTDLRIRKFDRIVYNFPHAGFKGKEDQMHLINLHRQLVQGFFYNASYMLQPNGEVHVTHKTEAPYNKWNLEELASKNSLVLIECADFDIKDYPGYNNKRGDGVRRDLPFRLGKCSTFKFGFGDIHKKKKARRAKASKSHFGSVRGVKSVDGSRKIGRINHPLAIRYPQSDYIFNAGGQPQTNFVISADGIGGNIFSPPRIGISRVIATDREGLPREVYSQPSIGIGSIPRTNFDFNAEGIRRRVYYSSPRIGINSAPSRLFGYPSEDVRDMVRMFGPDFGHDDRRFLRNGYEVYMNNEEPSRCVHGYGRLPEGHDSWSGLRRAWPRRLLLGEAQETESAWLRERSKGLW